MFFIPFFCIIFKPTANQQPSCLAMKTCLVFVYLALLVVTFTRGQSGSGSDDWDEGSGISGDGDDENILPRRK